jgi:hypothetical protein
VDFANGTYTSAFVINFPIIGLSRLILDGDTTTPSNVLLQGGTSSVENEGAITAYRNYGYVIEVQGFRFNSTASFGIFCEESSHVKITGVCDFHTCDDGHIYATNKATVSIFSNYNITGGSVYHLGVYDDGFINGNTAPATITITGTPTFSSNFCIAGRTGRALLVNKTWSGSVSSAKYTVEALSGLWVYGGTNLPGSGTTVDAKAYVIIA